MNAERNGPSDVELVLPPEPASVTRARHAVRDLARQLGAVEGDVALAVSEAVGNAVIHAFRGRDGGTIRVSAGPRRQTLVVTVADNGAGMMPDFDSPGLGVGIALISQVARDVRFSSSERGTTVSMSFALGGAAEGAGATGSRRRQGH